MEEGDTVGRSGIGRSTTSDSGIVVLSWMVRYILEESSLKGATILEMFCVYMG